jgi:hypothetical protein
VKSSITGDENDYIVDYKRRFPTYPHETTADQLFSEEQFEAYRALGFHAVNEVFWAMTMWECGRKPAQWQGTVLADPLVKAAKDLLKWSGHRVRGRSSFRIELATKFDISAAHRATGSGTAMTVRGGLRAAHVTQPA